MFAFADIHLTPLTVSILISFVIPVITGLATKYGTSPKIKSLITLVLNAVQALVVTATMTDGSAIFTQAALTAFAISLAISITVYLGVYRPFDITSSTPTGKLAPTKGI